MPIWEELKEHVGKARLRNGFYNSWSHWGLSGWAVDFYLHEKYLRRKETQRTVNSGHLWGVTAVGKWDERLFILCPVQWSELFFIYTGFTYVLLKK